MKNQEGFAPIAIILIGVLVLGVVGYILTSKNKIGIVGTALNANCDLKDADLCKYVNQAMTGEYFKNGVIMTTLTTDKAGKKSESVIEMDGKNNTKMITLQDDKEIMSIIRLGTINYSKDLTDGKWWKYESKTDQKSETTDQKSEDIKEQVKKYTEEYKDKTSYKKIGKEVCGTLTCFKYQMTITDMPDYTQYIYFDDREYLMRKTRMEDKSGMVSETSYEYKTVSITAPTPIKEGNPYIAGTGINQEQLKKIQEQIKQSQTQEETKSY